MNLLIDLAIIFEGRELAIDRVGGQGDPFLSNREIPILDFVITFPSGSKVIAGNGLINLLEP